MRKNEKNFKRIYTQKENTKIYFIEVTMFKYKPISVHKKFSFSLGLEQLVCFEYYSGKALKTSGNSSAVQLFKTLPGSMG